MRTILQVSVAVTAITGVIWAIMPFYLPPKEKSNALEERKKRILVKQYT